MRNAVRLRGRFIEGSRTSLAAVIWTPPPGVAPRFAVLHVPAAFEEMNKSRRMVALQARAFAAAGGCVVAYDPSGTGDSAGDHGEATWVRWRDDAAAAWAFVRNEFSLPGVLWGLRLGALLTASVAADVRFGPSALLLWQPVASGATYVNQFLRLAAASEIAGRAGPARDGRTLRATLAAGGSVDIAGYTVHPDLVAGCGTVNLEAVALPACPVIWRESSPDAPGNLSAWAQKIAQRWDAAGVPVDVRAVRGPSFWASVEIEESPALIEATTESVTRQIIVPSAVTH
jgi:exosortase A-associated hydrolase 2